MHRRTASPRAAAGGRRRLRRSRRRAGSPGDYPLGPDSLPQDGVPKGRLEGPVRCSRARSSRTRSGATGSTCPAQYTGDSPGQRARVPGRPARDQSEGVAAGRAGAREPDSQEGHPGHDRHLHHAGPARRRLSGRHRHRQSQQPRRGVRLAHRRLRPLHRGGDAAGSGEEVQADDRSGRTRDRRHEQRRDLRVHGRLAQARSVPQRDQHDRQLHVDRLPAGDRTGSRWCRAAISIRR